MHLSCVNTISSAAATDHWSGHKNKTSTNTGGWGGRNANFRWLGGGEDILEKKTGSCMICSLSVLHVLMHLCNYERKKMTGQDYNAALGIYTFLSTGIGCQQAKISPRIILHPLQISHISVKSDARNKVNAVARRTILSGS